MNQNNKICLFSPSNALYVINPSTRRTIWRLIWELTVTITHQTAACAIKRSHRSTNYLHTCVNTLRRNHLFAQSATRCSTCKVILLSTWSSIQILSPINVMWVSTITLITNQFIECFSSDLPKAIYTIQQLKDAHQNAHLSRSFQVQHVYEIISGSRWISASCVSFDNIA